MQGSVQNTSWVLNCSIHDTYNRAVTIHGTQNAVVNDNVAYNTQVWGGRMCGRRGVHACLPYAAHKGLLLPPAALYPPLPPL